MTVLRQHLRALLCEEARKEQEREYLEFESIHACYVTDHGTISLWLKCIDGSLHAVQWPIDWLLAEKCGEMSPPTKVPDGATVQ
jgi:hypothetical protein